MHPDLLQVLLSRLRPHLLQPDLQVRLSHLLLQVPLSRLLRRPLQPHILVRGRLSAIRLLLLLLLLLVHP